MGRFLGVDAARTAAIIGMILLHTVPPAELSSIPIIGILCESNRPQLLFALLDGVALGIISSGVNLPSQKREMSRRIGIRGIFLIALGLFLGTFASGVVIILDYYGVYFLLVIPLLFARWRTLLLTAIVIAAVGPIVVWLTYLALDGVILPGYLQLLASWLVLGQYPAVVWMAYVLLGIVLTRCGFFSPLATRMACWIGVLALAGATVSTLLELPDPLGVVVENVAAGGAAFVSVWGLVRVLRALDLNRRHARYGRIIFAMGVVPLSVYTVHVIVISIIVQSTGVGGLQSIATLGMTLFVCQVGASAWLMFARRGPLEQVSTWLSVPRLLDARAPIVERT
ncbi:DUF1624 domain-containing protein [Microbacterium sp. BF1]|uniref:DUF1624 domain-containing protein n=1 Tax=Microbacterium sp. BF1 TaxID=2821146 RepID=UPI001C4DDA82|nr:DUF1624 domain-containing protein [Microbacterium sp. BF1]